MIESMACGTPVIANNYGAVPEIVENKKTGFVIDKSIKKGKLDLEKMTGEISNAVLDIKTINRENCRKSIEEKFSIQQEADAYLNLYNRLISQNL